MQVQDIETIPTLVEFEFMQRRSSCIVLRAGGARSSTTQTEGTKANRPGYDHVHASTYLVGYRRKENPKYNKRF